MSGKRQLRAKLYGYAGYRVIENDTCPDVIVQAPNGDEKRVSRGGIDVTAANVQRFVFAAFGREE